MKKLSLCVIVSAGLVAAPVAAPAKCARLSWSSMVITQNNKTVPASGGVLVGATLFGRYGGAGNQDPSVTNLSLRRGKQSVGLRVERLAPGLSKYVPRRSVRGTWNLIGTRTKRTVRFAKGARIAIRAPRVGAIKLSQTPFRGRYGSRGVHTRVTASMIGKVPANVVGVIVYRRKAKQRKRTLVPMLFQRVTAASPNIALYDSPGRCQSDVRGLIRPRVGERVYLRWVDAFGRLSALSRPVRVIKK